MVRRDNGQIRMHRKFHLNIMVNFSVRVTVHWDRLCREAVDYLSLEILKNCVHAILCHVFKDGPA